MLDKEVSEAAADGTEILIWIEGETEGRDRRVGLGWGVGPVPSTQLFSLD